MTRARNVYTKKLREGGTEMDKETTLTAAGWVHRWMQRDTDMIIAALKGIAELNEMEGQRD